MNDCKYPNCKHEANSIYALVDLCDEHQRKIKRETRRFYDNATLHGLQAAEYTIRKHYYKIAPLISWSKFNQEKHYARG